MRKAIVSDDLERRDQSAGRCVERHSGMGRGVVRSDVEGLGSRWSRRTQASEGGGLTPARKKKEAKQRVQVCGSDVESMGEHWGGGIADRAPLPGEGGVMTVDDTREVVVFFLKVVSALHAGSMAIQRCVAGGPILLVDQAWCHADQKGIDNE